MKENNIIDVNPEDMIEYPNTLTDEQLETVVSTISENTSEVIKKYRDIKKQAEEGLFNSDVIDTGMINANSNDVSSYVTADEEGYIATDMSIFDVDEGKLEQENEEAFNKALGGSVKSVFDLSDEEVINLLSVVSEYRKDPEYKVYKNLGPKMQSIIRKTSMDANVQTHTFVNPQVLEQIAKMFIDSFIEEAELNESFVDLEKALNEAMQIPSMIDLYSEHTDEVMNIKLPELIDQLKETEPEKAQLMENVRSSFNDAYNFSRLQPLFENNSRVRKSVRKKYEDYIDFCDDVNRMNHNSKFKMNDARMMYKAIMSIFNNQTTDVPEEDLIYEDDIKKFIVLVCMSFEGLNPEDVVDASYIYYTIKNIIVLEHTTEAKTNFSIELINNITRIIFMIRDKEIQIYEQNKASNGESRKQKRSVRNKCKR